VGRYAAAPDQVVRWLQCGLGTLTVLCYFFFARRAFGSNRVAFLSGLFGAVYPFWVCATAELADGILTSFLLAACLALGTRGSQVGGAFTSLLFGLALAALAMVRGALLPFALVAMLWFLWRCRQYRWGWFAALLALLGFANGLAPWGVRNYRIYGEILPVVSSAYLHLWMGNNPDATGGTLDEQELRSSLSDARRQEVLAEPNQARRYALLGKDSLEEIAADPAAAFGRRFTAAETFVLGQRWREHRQLGLAEQAEGIAEPPAWLREHFDLLLNGSLVALLALALLGWRWTYAWAWHARLATLAVIWIPLPYVLSHGEALSGPRLPLDGVLLCYAAYAALAWLPERPRAPAAAA
jgi:4-amino-4-deoxy-L-arabinose transferase-like glycosyltransferase